MGYTHYWDTKKCTEFDQAGYRNALPVIRAILKRHDSIVCYEFDQPERAPVVSHAGICFNGKGSDGHETFSFHVNGVWEFCKTARKPYDLPVCEVLLVLKAYLPGMNLASDGFAGYLDSQPELDENWPEAIQNVKQYGIHYDVRVTCRREPFCDMEPVLLASPVEASTDAAG